MGKQFDMKVDKPLKMDAEHLQQLQKIVLAPYMQIATNLIGKERHAGGNMFRHQMDTMAILIDYGYIDSTLLKASVIHDVVEDIPGFDQDIIINTDSEGRQVLDLVLEVTKREGEQKSQFLRRILVDGSQKAKILKCADRISNMISLGFVTDEKFIERYCDETEFFIFPIALEVDYNMYQELISLVMTRRQYLVDSGYLNRKASEKESRK
jgi:GTP pyrophosphokinase